MRLLLDSHTIIWAVDDPARLSAAATAAILDPANERLVSAGTVWELAIKFGLGNLTLSLPYRQWMERAIADLQSAILPISVEHADVQAGLPMIHRDPFDRLLVAQALTEGVQSVSVDVKFDPYGVTRLW